MSDAKISGPTDLWLTDDGPAALTRRIFLEPVEGMDSVIFPPSYPIAEEGKAGYNIDTLPAQDPNGRPTKVCQIDSVGSQANRIEPLFAKPPYNVLVPQVIITAGEHSVNLLNVGHRIGDAVVRCSSLRPLIDEALKAIKNRGDATQLAKLAPTSLVFGFWDSRDTQLKMPRVVRSVIRAFDVEELRRSAQYSTVAGVILHGEQVEETALGKKAERGFTHVPVVRIHGGVLVRGDIRRDAILNLAALRSIAGADDEATIKIRRYILGLALVAFAANQQTSLREGCELIPSLDESGQPKTETRLVTSDGRRLSIGLTTETSLAYAIEAAKGFGVGPGGKFPFDKKTAQDDLKKSKS